MKVRKSGISAVCLGLLMLGGCSAMLIGEGGTDSPAIGSDSRSSTQVTADAALAEAVAAAFGGESMLEAANIAISAKSGVVTLAGTVDSFELREQAVDVAGAVSGVSRVSNQIQVKTQG